RLVPHLKSRVLPVGSYAIVTEPLTPALQQRINPKGRTFTDSRIFLHYFRLTPDGRLLFGGHNNLSPDRDLIDSARRLYMQMVQVFPDLRNIPITHSWTGKLGVTFDLMPHIGRIDGIYYALGYGGHGASMATYLGAEVGKLLCGQIKESPFMTIPHPTHFFYRNHAWFLPPASWWYRFLDWLY
ncbi:MAG: FAD-binding oxidoreductase, partial [Anaerolineales bacterium]|nr:FAD-binding oxidoreductase [Anaerolineales bacterium]